ncbi:MAG: type II toxin-antitoxin system RelE/ParE family toxin [Patescibacteria group bacterium]
MFKIIISPKAIRQLRLLKFIHKEAVDLAIDDLKFDPESGKKLKDKLSGKYSYRVGVYRIIYKINEKNKIVYIMSAGHQSIVYG